MSEEPPKIRKLDETVVNRIAAGEVIQRPANALKELIENSLDAKSTSVQVIVRNGGLKLLQIQDNGVGIRTDDLPIVCERFTTSKLREFDDLRGIATYGFRGEALASVSHVAHLTIVTKTDSEKCAFRASYEDGNLKGPPVPTAATRGTQIVVEDLFYNMNVRRRALRSPAEEYQKIFDVVSKYAIHNCHVGFGLKKYGENNDIKTVTNSSHVDNIRVIYGNEIARELIEFDLENSTYKFKLKGLVTNPNYSTKKPIFLCFVNHRLVDCQPLRKCLAQTYSNYLPKNGHPFVYIGLELDPATVDVNVHPTKHEVRFLHEEEIVELIANAMETKLLGTNGSRVFYTKGKLPVLETSKSNGSDAVQQQKDFVRTDANEQKITRFFREVESEGKEEGKDEKEKERKRGELEVGSSDGKKVCKSALSQLSRFETKLISVLELREEVERSTRRHLRDLFAQHVYVGSVDPRRALVQHGTELYLCDTESILRELFYQFLVFNFQNFEPIALREPVPVGDLAAIALDRPEVGWTPSDGDKMELARRVSDILTEKAEMLAEYFSLEIDEFGNLKSLPLLLKDYIPDTAGLPVYVLRLASEVDWDTEKECFRSFARETSNYYSQIYLDGEGTDEKGNWKWTMEHVLYPAVKRYLLPPSSFMEDGTVLRVADLPKLYKVFERC